MPAAVNAEGVVRPRKSKSGDSKGGCGLALHLPPAGRSVIRRSSDASGSSRFGLQEEKGGDRSAADPHYRRGFPPLPGSRPADLAPPARTLRRGALFRTLGSPVRSEPRTRSWVIVSPGLFRARRSEQRIILARWVYRRGSCRNSLHRFLFPLQVFSPYGWIARDLRPGFASRLPVVGGSARWARAPFGPRSSFIPVP